MSTQKNNADNIKKRGAGSQKILGVENHVIKKVESKYHTKYYNRKNQLHNINDLPAIIYKNGILEWYQNGQKHREGDQPAVIVPDETQEWWLNGKKHRDNDLPAYIRKDGMLEWWQNGKKHRENNKPAVIWQNGRQEWWKEGKQQTDINNQQKIKEPSKTKKLTYKIKSYFLPQLLKPSKNHPIHQYFKTDKQNNNN